MMQCVFDHVHILTSDPDEVAAWFERMLDAEVLRSTQDGKTRVDVRLGGQMIFIMPVSASAAGVAPRSPHFGLDHIGLTVENIDSVYEELKRRGAEFDQLVHTPRPGIRIMFLRGPESISVELLERNQRFR